MTEGISYTVYTDTTTTTSADYSTRISESKYARIARISAILYELIN
jgi:hypothetical protein